MMVFVYALGPVLLTILSTILIIKYPISISKPTDRGLHDKPIPSSGGIALLLSYISVSLLAVLTMGHSITLNSMILILIFGTLLGYLDDKYYLSKLIRFASQFVFALWIVSLNIELSIFLKIVWVLFIVYLINIYNFMDGIDGLATAQAIFVLLSMSILDYYYSIGHLIIFIIPLVVFLFYNISPAKIFLGNAGSYLIAILLSILFYKGSILDSNLANINYFASMLILLTVFICDTTYTLISRFINQYNKSNFNLKQSLAKITTAHRLHNYQIMTIANNNHNKTTSQIMLYNFFWCLPLAYLLQIYEHLTLFFLFLSYLPYLILCYKNKSGIEK